MRQLYISKRYTVREFRSLDIYFSEIGKISVIGPQEEVMLARKIQSGDPQALEQLTKTNLGFVVSVAKQYQHRGLSLQDLISEGNLGLITAAKRYDESKGFRFISYAVWWIRQTIIAAISLHARMVRLPYNKVSLLSKLHQVSCHLEQNLGRKPTVGELAEYLDLECSLVADTLNSERYAISLDEPHRHDERFAPLDVLRSDIPDPDDGMMYESIKTEIQLAMRVLDKRGREILILFFGLGQFSKLSLEEIGERYNISKEHAGRLKTKALGQLRNCSQASNLMSYLS